MAAEVEVGMANLAKHIENVRAFGIQPVVAINTRPDDEPELLELIKARSLEAGAFGAAIHNGFGAGRRRARSSSPRSSRPRPRPSRTSGCSTTTTSRSRRRSRRSRRPSTAPTGSSWPPPPARRSPGYEKQGLAHLPICMAKTHLSLSHDPLLRNRPTGFIVPIRDIRVYSGAGMLVPLCGDMLQMPGFGAQAGRVRDRHRRERRDGRAVLAAERGSASLRRSRWARLQPSHGSACRRPLG